MSSNVPSGGTNDIFGKKKEGKQIDLSIYTHSKPIVCMQQKQ